MTKAVVEPNPNARLEAFCDGVFAIALTLLIIDIRVPDVGHIASTPELWLALRHLAPAGFAFLLSFVVILITWVNHHAALKLVNRSSAPFIYANGFLLLTVVVIPFPTSLLGEFLLTDHAVPAVVLYEAVLVASALAWILWSATAVSGGLTKDDASTATVRASQTRGYFALGLYALLTAMAFWLPLVAAALTALSWAFWLVLSVRLKHV